MFSNVVQRASSLANLKLAAFTVGLSTKVPLDKTQLMHGLSAFHESFPQLSESKFDEKGDLFRLGNQEQEYERELLLTVSNASAFNFSWGVDAAFGSIQDVRRVYDTLQDGFSLLAINVALWDLQVHFFCEWSGQHYQTIWNAYFTNSPLFGLFAPERILQDDLRLRGLLDDNTVAMVTVSSDVADAEIKRGVFKDDRLKASVGIAYTGTLAADSRIAVMLQERIDRYVDFLSNSFMGSVVEPLDASLTSLRGSRSDDES